MKRTLAAGLVLLALAAHSLPTPPPSGRIRLLWNYPTNELSTNLTFKVYHSTNLALPIIDWTVLTNIVGTNTTLDLVVVPGPHFFAMTASNFWGESDFSNVASTPELPRGDTGLEVQRK